MHLNTFLNTPGGQKYLFKEHFSGGLEVCKNTFLATPDIQKYLFLKFLVVWKYAQMHQNTF
jgi:hypothetical protein